MLFLVSQLLTSFLLFPAPPPRLDARAKPRICSTQSILATRSQTLHARRTLSPVCVSSSSSEKKSLRKSSVLEVWHEKGLRVGNFRGHAPLPSKALLIELSSGETITADAGQLVDVWPECPGHIAAAPNSTSQWAHLLARSSALLRELPPHMLDLRRLWQQVSQMKRKSISTSAAADIIFANVAGHYKVDIVEQLARRMAAGQLLANERVLFKRAVPTLVPDSSSDGWHLVASGFKCMPRAQANSRAELSLLQSLQKISRGERVSFAASELPLLADLELLAMGISSSSPSLARLLEAFNHSADTIGARLLLLDAGLWVQDDEDDDLEEADGDTAIDAEQLPLSIIEPFPKVALAEASDVAAGMHQRRLRYAHTDHLNEDVLSGRVDLREICPRAYAIDGPNTEFRDDAISYDIDSNTLYVHIADLTSAISAGSLLDEVARLRLQSIYASSIPLHMLPPSLLRSISLSDTLPNECLTAVIKLDVFGRVQQKKLIRTIIPPVRLIEYDEVDSLLLSSDFDSPVHRELKAFGAITLRRAESKKVDAPSPQTLNGGGGGGGASMQWKGTSSGGLAPRPVLKTPANVLVNEALGIFSYAARSMAKHNNMLRLPQMEHRRIATAPLRRYADLISQRQLCAALSGEPTMPLSEIATLEQWIRSKKADIVERLNQQQAGAQRIVGLRELEAHCLRQATASGSRFAEIDATVTKVLGSSGSGAQSRTLIEVRLATGGMIARTSVSSSTARKLPIRTGMKLRVRLHSIDAKRGQVDVSVISCRR